MAMETQQIYSIVNSITAQSMGTAPITAVDTGSFIALGNFILNSSSTTEGWLNTLVQRIAVTVLVQRAYRSKFRDFIKGDLEWGNVIQKIAVDMPEASVEESIPLVNGQSVDQYKINNPVAHQWLFANRTPWKIWITIQRHWLTEGFLNEAAMEGFIGTVFLAVANKLELANEDLTRAAMNNYAGMVGPKQTINLVTMYNTEKGLTGDAAIPTGMAAMYDADFMRYASGIIREIGRNMTTMSTIYNIEGQQRHSPIEYQRFILLSRFRTQLETIALYSAFNDDYLQIVSDYTVPFWQASGTTVADWNSMASITGTARNTAGEEVNYAINNIVGMLFDRDALGAYRKRRAVLTTPMNANGMYTNTFWHEDQTWFNATDENFLLFTLN